jgi:hypothetical protein
MSQLYPYRISISHARDYNEEYYKLEKMLTDYPNFDFRNYSVPRHDALDASARLKAKLLDQIDPTQVSLDLAGMYAAHGDWIQFEISEAKQLQKPIVGIRPWGQDRVPEVVQTAARVMHGWNVGPIVASIRELA